MKKAIFTAVLLSAVLALAFVSCGTSPERMEHISQVSREIDAGDYYVTQFNSFRDPAQQRNESRPIRPTALAFSTTRSGGSRSSENKYRPFRTSRPSWIRAEAPSEQDIDRAIAAYEAALRLEPSGTWVLRGEVADDYLYPPEGGIQARLENARRIKQQWLTVEKPQREQQAARVLSTNISIRDFNAGITREDANYIYSTVRGQNYVVDKATRSNYQVWVNSAWQPANVGTAEERQDIAPNPTPNNPNDFDILQNAQGTITIRGYTGTRINVVIPETISGVRVTGIANSAFARKSILSVVIPNTVTSIEIAAFIESTELRSVVLPNGITKIDQKTFEGCRALQSITIPNSVTIIEREAFKNCGLTSVTLSNRLEAIGQEAFRNNKITSIQLPNSLQWIGLYAFYNNQITNLVIPGSVVGLAYFSFGENPLSSLVIPASLARYRYGEGGFRGAFSNQSNRTQNQTTLTRVTLPANVDDLNLDGQEFGDSYYNFEDSLINFYRSQNKRAGTYVKENRIWRVQ
jgi:hypothetical protein